MEVNHLPACGDPLCPCCMAWRGTPLTDEPRPRPLRPNGRVEVERAEMVHLGCSPARDRIHNGVYYAGQERASRWREWRGRWFGWFPRLFRSM
jgi:hypothetical protein